MNKKIISTLLFLSILSCGVTANATPINNSMTDNTLVQTNLKAYRSASVAVNFNPNPEPGDGVWIGTHDLWINIDGLGWIYQGNFDSWETEISGLEYGKTYEIKITRYHAFDKDYSQTWYEKLTAR